MGWWNEPIKTVQFDLGKLWSQILWKNCIKPLTLGTSLASDTQKQPVSTGETSFCWILEPQLPFFYQPPIWDKINLRFGTGFISISLDFHSCLLISMGQNAVPIWPFLGVRSPASLSEWGGEPVYFLLWQTLYGSSALCHLRRFDSRLHLRNIRMWVDLKAVESTTSFAVADSLRVIVSPSHRRKLNSVIDLREVKMWVELVAVELNTSSV